jgi:hypothetical protein
MTVLMAGGKVVAGRSGSDGGDPILKDFDNEQGGFPTWAKAKREALASRFG